jgi:hypothetical protein
MHALVIAVFAVSTAMAQAPGGSTAPLSPPPPPPATATATPAPAPMPPPPAVSASSAADANAANIAAEGDGRWALIGTSTVVGLGYYGWTLPIAFNVTGGGQFAGAYMLTGAASFFLPFALTLNSPVTWGQANLFYGGATHGPAHAGLFLLLLNPTGITFQQVALAGLMGGALEISGGLAWATFSGMTAGTSHAIIVGSDIGAGLGFALSTIVAASVSLSTAQVPAGLALAGAAGGAITGSVMGPLLHLTWGDAELLWLSTLVGSFVPIPFVTWANPSDIRPYTILAILGGTGGVLVGTLALMGMHLDLGQAMLMDLGTLAGGLVGLGTSLILGATSDFRIGLTASMIGLCGGYAISYFAMKVSAPPAKKSGTTMQVSFNPTALTELMAPKPPAGATLAMRQDHPPPALALTGTF